MCNVCLLQSHFFQLLIQHQETCREELQAHHEAALLELSVQLEKEAKDEEQEYLQSTERKKLRILQEKQSKLNAMADATALNDEHKKLVKSSVIFNILSMVSSLLFTLIFVTICSYLNNTKVNLLSLNRS